jgi:rhodanese-related sulfurtransferase
MKSRTIVWIVVAVIVAAAAFFVFRPTGGGIENVDASGAIAAQEAGARVIDVRTVGEYEAGHIPGSENVPMDQLPQVMQGWDREAPLVVYCATGSRSVSAVEQLKAAGFKDIKHFSQGIVAYQGPLDGGQQVAAAPAAAEPETLGTPVMYEFYTDW